MAQAVPHILFMPSAPISAQVDLGQDLLLEAMKAGIERVQGHLDRVERITHLKHLEVKCRVFVPGKTDEARFCFLLGLIKCSRTPPLV